VRVLVAMSGGVDSSVAAALLAEAGHDVVGATMKLWGGPSDTGCCSVADVEDARRVAQQLGITHHVFNFTADFDARVVEPYVAAHAAGRTPNPCVDCNRHLKFDRFLRRARQLGFDAVATGHHARIVTSGGGRRRLVRGRDRAKDQSYVLSVLSGEQLARCLLPVGELTKAEVRGHARTLGLRTAAKPDSQDVCFITATGGRRGFLTQRIELHPGRIVEATTGETVGSVPAVELVTVGQRRGLGGEGRRRYAVEVDVAGGAVMVASQEEALTDAVRIRGATWVEGPLAPGSPVLVQLSAHGRAVEAVFEAGRVRLAQPHRPVAPGQTVALYDGDAVLGAAEAV
jgi:tRNA-specific 2-thiouridylase